MIKFNAPIDLNGYKSILLLGIGGGYDIFGGIPLYLTHRSCHWVFANYNIKMSKMLLAEQMDEQPERRLYEWLEKEGHGERVYALPRVGVNIMIKYLEEICRVHQIDCMVLVDGGVDSLMHGDEYDAGTVIEDTIVMTAAAAVSVKDKYLVCVGFGAELEEGLCHHHALENISELAKAGAFLGSCSLTKGMAVYDKYKNACEYAWAGDRRKSHIHTKVISAIEGEFGDNNLYEGVDAQVVGAEEIKNFITPLMSMYWFFDFAQVVKRNKLMPVMMNSNTHTDALSLFKQSIHKIRTRHSERLPY